MFSDVCKVDIAKITMVELRLMSSAPIHFYGAVNAFKEMSDDFKTSVQSKRKSSKQAEGQCKTESLALEEGHRWIDTDKLGQSRCCLEEFVSQNSTGVRIASYRTCGNSHSLGDYDRS